MKTDQQSTSSFTQTQKLTVFTLSILIIVFAMPGRSTGFCAFIEPILQSTGISRDVLSTIFMFTTMIGGFSMLFIGKKIDQIGTRKSLFIALSLWTITMTMLGNYSVILNFSIQYINKSVFHIIFFSITLSLARLLGQNILTTIGHVQIVHIFRKKTGLAVSIGNIMIAIAFGFSPKLINKLIEIISWEHSYKLFAIISLTMLILSIFFVPKNKQPQITNQQIYPTEKVFSKKEIFKNKSFWCVILALCVNSFIGSGIVIHAIDIFREIGESTEATMNSLVYIGFMSMISGVFFGKLIDANKCKQTLILMLFSQLIGMFSLEYIHNSFAFLMYVVAIGCSWGGYGLFFSAIWPKIFPIKNIGEVSGTVCCFTILTGASSIPLMSLSKSLTGSYFNFIHLIEIFVVLTICFVLKNFKLNCKNE